MIQTDFYDENEINWFPINLDKKIPSYPLGYNCKCDFNDFKKLDKMEILERHDYFDECNALAIDTNDIYIIDVDFKDDIDYESLYPDSYNFVQKLIEDGIPYKKSTTKKNGKHFFFRNPGKFDKNRIQLNLQDIEILCGQWAYAPKNRTIKGGKIKEIDISKYLDTTETCSKKQAKQFKKSKLNKNIVESKEMNQKILKYTEIIDIKYIDNYDSWTKIVWSLANDKNENHYNIAMNMSMRSSKFEQETFDKLWLNSKEGNSLGTMYYYAKISNPDKYYQLKGEEVSEDYFTEDRLAEIFYLESEDDLILKGKDAILYIYNDKLWYEDRKLNKLKYFIGKKLNIYLTQIGIQLYKKQGEYVGDDEASKMLYEIYKKRSEVVNKTIAQVSSATKKKNIAECVIQILSVKNFDDYEFDTEGYILPFKDKVYDFRTHEFRQAKREDYILTFIPYHLEERDENKIKELDDLFNKIFPDKNIKENYFSFLSTGLYGQHVEKFVIANGGGGNGKGLINELVQEMLSVFCYKCSNAILLQPLKDGINTQLANMNNKRLIVYSEPDSTVKKICGSTVKELTGGKDISAEKKYSMDDKVRLKGTHILETNNKPLIDGRIDDSYIRRLVDIPFGSTFTDDKELLKETSRINTFEANTKYKTDEWKQEYKHQLFWYLVDFIKNYKSKYGYDCIEKVELCEEVKKRTREYLENSDEKFEWFKNHYQKKEDSFLQLKDVFHLFKTSDYYQNLTKKDKRAENYTNLVKYMITNVNFRAYYREKCYVGEGTKKRQYRNVLLGWEFKPIEYENDSEDEACEL